MLRSSSEEVAAIRIRSKVFRSREKVSLNRIMRFVKVNGIDFNSCLLNTVQRMICSKNQLISIRLFTPPLNICRFCATEVLSFSTVNVKHGSIVNNFQKLFTELCCQKNTRSNYNNPCRTIRIESYFSVFNHTNSLATTSRDDNLTFSMFLHRFQSILLMGAKGDHGFPVWYGIIIAEDHLLRYLADSLRTGTSQ